MGMIKFDIVLEHIKTGEILEFPIKANNGSECVGRIIEGKAKFPQPSSKDNTKLTIQSFLPNGEWKIMSMESKFSYPEMVGRVI